GDMMEGVSAEAASLAGHWKLSNLCWIYDNNHISIEGSTKLAFTEDVASRFLAYGWNVTRVGHAHDLDILARAFDSFLHTTDRHRPPRADLRRRQDRLGGPPQGGDQGGRRRAARRRGGPPHQAQLRLARGRPVPRPRRRLRPLQARRRRPRQVPPRRLVRQGR